jgi:hypothetical protein
MVLLGGAAKPKSGGYPRRGCSARQPVTARYRHHSCGCGYTAGSGASNNTSIWGRWDIPDAERITNSRNLGRELLVAEGGANVDRVEGTHGVRRNVLDKPRCKRACIRVRGGDINIECL